MPITRSLLHTHEILEFLCDEDGEIKIQNGDYGERFGVMGQPINQVDCPEYGLFENSKTDPKARIAVFREGTSDFVKFPDYDMSPF